MAAASSVPAVPVGTGADAGVSRDGAPLSVSQLAVLAGRALRDHLPATIRLIGEIGQFRERTHWYFDLKDAGAVMSCVMFASAARRVGFVPSVGQQVLLTGRVEFYEKGGRTQFMADKMEPVGAGALDLAFRRLCEELRGIGWFDDSRKRPLPILPRRVAVVTSRTGAALQDVLDTARRRCPSVPIGLVDVRVQGEGAAAEVAAAVRRLGRMRDALELDVILVTRGGGSMEDLWAFNERIVAEAIVNSPVPVVAAVGHETDTTIAELVADLRAATPTQAAMRIFPDREALDRQLTSMIDRLAVQVSRHIKFDRERLRGLARHPFLLDPGSRVEKGREDLAGAMRHLGAAMRQRMSEARGGLDRAAARLERHRPATVYARREGALNEAALRLRSAMRANLERRVSSLDSGARGLDLVGPPSVFRRGYSMTLRSDGRAVRAAGEVVPGERITTRVGDGAFDSTVVGPDHGGLGAIPTALGRARAAARPRRSRGAGADADHPGLFGF